MAMLLLFSACDLLPTLPTESTESTESKTSSDDERLTESDFAILIGRKSGLITYLGPNGNVFTINQAGRNKTSITSDSNLDQIEDLNRATDATYYLLPTWTTSGQKLAYAQHQITDSRDQDFAQAGMIQIANSSLPSIDLGQQQNGRSSTYSIYSANADGMNQQRLWMGTARPIYMYWAPDGQTLSVLLQEPNGSELQFALLSTENENENLASSEQNENTFQVVDVGGPLFWDWAPHGSQILTHIGSTTLTERVSLLSLESQIIEEILDIAPARFASPDISPNGKLVMLPLQSDAADDDDTWITVMNLATRNKSVIEKLDGDLFVGGSFSPNSDKVGYIASKGTAEGELAVYTLANGDLFISESKNLIAFFWSPDSSKIAAFEAVPTDESSANSRPRYGLHIVDIENNTTVKLFNEFETTTQFTEVLTFYSQYQRSATIWSPDSRAVVLPIRTPEGPMIIAMDVTGTIHPRTLASGVLAFWSAD